MVFSSSVFLFLFLPAVWILYTLIPARHLGIKNVILGLFSLLFYAFGEPVYIILMLCSIVFNYFAAILLEKYPDAILAVPGKDFRRRGGWQA